MPDIFGLLYDVLYWLSTGVATLLTYLLRYLVLAATTVIGLIAANMPECADLPTFVLIPSELLAGFRSVIALVEPFLRWFPWGTMWQIVGVIIFWRFIEWFWPYVWKVLQWIWSGLAALISLIPF